MSKSRITICITSIFAFMIFSAGITNNDGRAGRTGSPGENPCTSSCHSSFTLNSGDGSIIITCDNMPNWKYEPSTAYTLNVTVQKPGMAVFGLGFEALNNSSGSTFLSIGTLTPSTGTQIKNATVSGSSRQNIVHTLNSGVTANSKTFTFTWTSPSTIPTNSTITFYSAGVAGNNNGNNVGDYVYTTNQEITPLNPTSSINLDSDEFSFSVFPNPAQNYFNVIIDSQLNLNRTIDLYSLDGKVVYNSTLNNDLSGISTIEIPSNLSNGFYFAKVSTNNSSKIKRIFINR